MDKETKLILQNQKEILRALFRVTNIDVVGDGLRRQYSKTTMALVEWDKPSHKTDSKDEGKK